LQHPETILVALCQKSRFVLMFMHVGACGGEQKEEVARRAGYDAQDQQLQNLKKQLQEEKDRSRRLKEEAQLSQDHV
jgi:hypothetical protein